MCAPLVFGLMFALTAGTTLYSIDQQNKAAKEQRDAINAQSKANIEAIDTAESQAEEKADLDRNKLRRQHLRQTALKKVAMSEAGVLGGNTAIRELITGNMQAAEDQAIVGKNLDFVRDQSARQRDAAAAGANVQLSNLQYTSPLLAGLQAVSGGLSAGLSGATAVGGF